MKKIIEKKALALRQKIHELKAFFLSYTGIPFSRHMQVFPFPVIYTDIPFPRHIQVLPFPVICRYSRSPSYTGIPLFASHTVYSSTALSLRSEASVILKLHTFATHQSMACKPYPLKDAVANTVYNLVKT